MLEIDNSSEWEDWMNTPLYDYFDEMPRDNVWVERTSRFDKLWQGFGLGNEDRRLLGLKLRNNPYLGSRDIHGSRKLDHGPSSTDAKLCLRVVYFIREYKDTADSDEVDKEVDDKDNKKVNKKDNKKDDVKKPKDVIESITLLLCYKKVKEDTYMDKEDQDYVKEQIDLIKSKPIRKPTNYGKERNV